MVQQKKVKGEEEMKMSNETKKIDKPKKKLAQVVKVCKSSTVFQRTPNWVVPREDGAINAAPRLR